MLMYIALAIVGLATGTGASMLGVGGGVIFVSAVYYLYSFYDVPLDFAMKSAVATSLAAILFTMISGGIGHFQKKNYIPRAVPYIAAGCVVGALTGARLTIILPGNYLKIIFGIMLIIISLRMIFQKQEPASTGKKEARQSAISFLVTGLSAGFTGGLLGVGGGIIIVPALSIWLGYPIHKTIGTSTIVIIFTALAGLSQLVFATPSFGTAPHTIGYLNYAAAAALIPTSMLGARLGVILSLKTRPSRLRKGFALVSLLVGIEMTGIFTLVRVILENLF